MKFQQKLEANKHSDWPYIDYKGLKAVLKALVKSAGKAASSSLQASPDRGNQATVFMALQAPLLESGESPQRSFREALREQRDRVQDFYLQELERHHAQIQLLLEQFELPHSGSTGASPVSFRAGKSKPTERTQWRTEASLAKASTDVYRTLQHLRNYAILNYTGLLKLAKKFDKQHLQELEEQHAKWAEPVEELGGSISPSLAFTPKPLLPGWTEELSASNFVSSDTLDELCNRLELAFANTFCDGSIQAARATLLVRKERPNANLMISLGMRIGFSAGLLLWLAWDISIDAVTMHLGNLHKRGGTMWLDTQLPLIRTGGAVVVLQYLWAICLFVWNRARINFEFMLDFGPKVITSPTVAASVATRTFIFYLLCLLLFTKALIGELPHNVAPGYFLVAMIILTVGSLIGQHGRTLLTSVVGFLMAPSQPVDFASVLLGDVLTSMVKPMQDFVYSICYVATGEFRLSYSSQGLCHDEHSLYHMVLVPLLCALPLWCRFMQCLRVAHDSQSRFPALPNALKYSISLLVVLFGEMHPAFIMANFDQPDSLMWVHVAWIGVYLLGTFYNIVWDVVMDWKLRPWDCEQKGLRPRRMFALPAVYYVAMGVDFVLRFAWTATLVPHWFAFKTNPDEATNFATYLMLPVVIIAELSRRCMWAIFRLESEHLHNTEGFRRVAVVPLHFDHAAEEGDEKQKPAFTKREVLLELLIYAAVVGVLAYGTTQDPTGRGRDWRPADHMAGMPPAPSTPKPKG